MINVKKYCGFRILKIKKYPITSSNSKRKSLVKILHLLSMKAGIAPISNKTIFLSLVKLLYVLL